MEAFRPRHLSLAPFTLSNRGGPFDIYVMNANGCDVRRLTDDPAHEYVPKWSPDGGDIAFVRQVDDQADIYVMAADGFTCEGQHLC
jgi:TolB protein